MAASMAQTPFPPNQEGHVLDEQGFIDPNLVQMFDWSYIEGAGHPSAPSNAPPNAPPNTLWQGQPPLPSGGDLPFDITGYSLPNDGAGAGEGIWDFSVDASNTGSYGAPLWPASSTETPMHNPWDPANQPFPSPMSEATSYAFTQSPYATEGPTGHPNQSTRSGTNSPAKTTNSTLPTPLLQPGDGLLKNPHPAPKRPAESAPRPSRPRTLKRHRSDTPSIASIASISTAGSASTVGSATTTLGGVLPINVDPRVASEQIRREAWERCKAEAHEMSQRRMMLMDHEHGALERETLRLQVNLGLMREAAKRGQEESDEEEAKAGRAEKWVDGA